MGPYNKGPTIECTFFRVPYFRKLPSRMSALKTYESREPTDPLHQLAALPRESSKALTQKAYRRFSITTPQTKTSPKLAMN